MNSHKGYIFFILASIWFDNECNWVTKRSSRISLITTLLLFKLNTMTIKKVTTKKADPKISSTKSYRKLTKDDTGKTSTAKKKPTKNAITVVKVIANSINLVFG
jgi:hypothetical protein